MRPYLHLYLLSVLILFIESCVPPAGWEPSGYIKSSYDKGRTSNPTRVTLRRIPTNDKTTVRVLLHTGEAKPLLAKSQIYFEDDKSNSSNTITPNRSGFIVSNDNIIIFEGNSYHGKIEITNTDNKFLYVNHVPMNEYIMSVVGHEMNKEWPIEALKAQSVLARTYVLDKIITNRDKKFDIDKTVVHQVYKGIVTNAPNLEKAATETSGEIIKYNGTLAKIFFFASCGGITAKADEVWTENIPYLDAIEADTCGINPQYRWHVKIPLTEFNAMFKSNISQIEVIERTNSGRAKMIKLTSSDGDKLIEASKFRQQIGGTKIKSTLFGIRINNNEVEIAGKGYGHGVGVCQNGAKELANKNMSYKQIILAYLPKVSISK